MKIRPNSGQMFPHSVNGKRSSTKRVFKRNALPFYGDAIFFHILRTLAARRTVGRIQTWIHTNEKLLYRQESMDQTTENQREKKVKLFLETRPHAASSSEDDLLGTLSAFVRPDRFLFFKDFFRTFKPCFQLLLFLYSFIIIIICRRGRVKASVRTITSAFASVMFR